jgi:hypothetical protein
MSKRGQIVLIALITIVIAAIVGLTYPRIASAYATGAFSLKVSATEDIALIIDTIYAYPYDVEVEYEVDLSKFIIAVSDGKVKLYGSSFVSLDSSNKIVGIDPIFSQYPFLPGNENINFILDKPKKIKFIKNDGKLSIKS